jgi:hypothetical protein
MGSTSYSGYSGSSEDSASSAEFEPSVSKLCRSENDFALWAVQVRLDPVVRTTGRPIQLQELNLPDWLRNKVPCILVP